MAFSTIRSASVNPMPPAEHQKISFEDIVFLYMPEMADFEDIAYGK